MARVTWQPWWRWPVYLAATMNILFVSAWFFLVVGAGGGLGFGGRTTLQVNVLVAATTLVFLIGSGLALRAILAAKDRRHGLAAGSVALSLLLVLAFWLSLNWRWL